MALNVQADFNGLFGDLLCLSHDDCGVDEAGRAVELRAGIEVVAFDADVTADGSPEFLVARGSVIRSPEWLACRGSRWSLRIEHGPRHVRRLEDA